MKKPGVLRRVSFYLCPSRMTENGQKWPAITVCRERGKVPVDVKNGGGQVVVRTRRHLLARRSLRFFAKWTI